MQPNFGLQPAKPAGRTGFARDLTDNDFSTVMNSVTAKGGIYVNFFYVKVRQKSRNAATNGQFDTRLCISKQPKGDRSTVAVRFITEEAAAREWPREFALFKQYEEVPTMGTPLSELPGISMSQIGILTINGLRSIEDLCEVSEDQIGQLGLDAVRARKTAVAWMERRQGSAEMISAADVEARFGLELETMKKQMAEMAERNKALEAQNAALQSVHGRQPATDHVAGATDAVGVDGREDLEYDVSKMPDPMSEGPDTSDGADDLGQGEIDPLMGD